MIGHWHLMISMELSLRILTMPRHLTLSIETSVCGGLIPNYFDYLFIKGIDDLLG